ncbi:acyl carrier protein [Nonomuraea sp. NPDC050786]|uniref:acyl carrier protein n=1 Tax=Nonomuraea sp. NPDC050786 TaxID=3154840 RepID=UPI0033E3DD0B
MPEPDSELAELTESLVTIWRQVLRMAEIDADSHLMDLGATSLTAVRLRSRVRAELGKEIDLVEFLEHPTPRELAPVIAEAPAWSGPQPWHQIEWTPESG